ncbi:MAG TPA: septum site-determining protein Ssd [Micromonosporaceae bacterium]|nr:septum site-determining protein Ssd [Micromonosporaceae bacterium]
MTADGELLDELIRLAAAAGVEIDVAPDPPAARHRYIPAPLVLIGIDAAAACHRGNLPRRPAVVLVGRSGEATAAWELAEALGAAHVAALPAAEPWLVERFAGLATGPAVPGRLIAVLGARGGAGASVLSAGLAVTAVRAGMRTLLVDGDPLGGGIDLVLGWESVHGLRWPALRETSGRVDAPAFVEALPRRGELVILSWDRGELVAVPAEAMAATVDAGRRGRDLVVVDLPRRMDDAAVLALQAADHALLVVPAELRAAVAAARVAAAVKEYCPSLAVVVRGPAPGRLTVKQVVEPLGLPLAGALRPDRGLARALERGEAPASSGRGPLAAFCRRFVDELVAESSRAAA